VLVELLACQFGIADNEGHDLGCADVGHGCSGWVADGSTMKRNEVENSRASVIYMFEYPGPP
jgi:hypothetical protein